MRPKHFINVLIDFYERAYAAHKASDLRNAALMELAIWAADQVATNNWHDAADRAGAVGAALMRAMFEDDAAEEAKGLSAHVRLHIADTEDPQPRT